MTSSTAALERPLPCPIHRSCSPFNVLCCVEHQLGPLTTSVATSQTRLCTIRVAALVTRTGRHATSNAGSHRLRSLCKPARCRYRFDSPGSSSFLASCSWRPAVHISQGDQKESAGGGSGLGKAASIRLAAERAHVVVTDLNLDSAQETTDDIRKAGGSAEAVKVMTCKGLCQLPGTCTCLRAPQVEVPGPSQNALTYPLSLYVRLKCRLIPLRRTR